MIWVVDVAQGPEQLLWMGQRPRWAWCRWPQWLSEWRLAQGW